jgi:hypothetical protein
MGKASEGKEGTRETSLNPFQLRCATRNRTLSGFSSRSQFHNNLLNEINNPIFESLSGKCEHQGRQTRGISSDIGKVGSNKGFKGVLLQW